MVYWSDDQFRNICVKIFVGLATAPECVECSSVGTEVDLA